MSSDGGVKQGFAAGTSIAAALILLVVGVVSILQGISAIATDELFVVGAEYIFELNTTAWGVDPSDRRHSRGDHRVCADVGGHMGTLRGGRTCLPVDHRQFLVAAALPDVVDPDHRLGHRRDLGRVDVGPRSLNFCQASRADRYGCTTADRSAERL